MPVTADRRSRERISNVYLRHSSSKYRFYRSQFFQYRLNDGQKRRQVGKEMRVPRKRFTNESTISSTNTIKTAEPRYVNELCHADREQFVKALSRSADRFLSGNHGRTNSLRKYLRGTDYPVPKSENHRSVALHQHVRQSLKLSSWNFRRSLFNGCIDFFLSENTSFEIIDHAINPDRCKQRNQIDYFINVWLKYLDASYSTNS